MKLHLDNDNNVVGFTSSCINYETAPGVEYNGTIPDNFAENCMWYKYENENLIFNEDKWNDHQREIYNLELKQKYIPKAETSLKNILKLLIKTVKMDDDLKIQASGLYEDWEAGKYQIGNIRNATGQTWECYQAHDNAIYPDIKPGNSAWYTFWRPLHGKSAKTARPFVPVQGAHDMYHVGEYIVWTDDNVYKCIQDTNFSPADYAQAWTKKGE